MEKYNHMITYWSADCWHGKLLGEKGMYTPVR